MERQIVDLLKLLVLKFYWQLVPLLWMGNYLQICVHLHSLLEDAANRCIQFLLTVLVGCQLDSRFFYAKPVVYL